MKNTSILKLFTLAILAIISFTIFSGCASQSKSTTVNVGVCAGPYGDMFKQAILPALEKQGYRVKIVEFSDYVQPNTALAEGDIDVNMFQHSTYLKKFSKDYNLDLAYITEIPTAAMGAFSHQLDTLEKLPQNATVAIPNDVTNLSRALRVLAQTGIITINPNVDVATATINDISQNPKNLSFKEINAEILPSVLDSVDLAIINGNYAMSAGLKLSDALYNEKLSDGYFNVIAVRSEDADAKLAKDIVSIVHSSTFRQVIEDKNNQYSAFAKPKDYEN